MDGQEGNLNTCATRCIFFAFKTGSEFSFQFRPQGLIKMADIGQVACVTSVRIGYFRVQVCLFKARLSAKFL